MDHVTKDIKTEQLENEIFAVLFAKYHRAGDDAGWLARDDAAVIVRNLEELKPILRRHLED